MRIFLAYAKFEKELIKKKLALAEVYRNKKLDRNFLKISKEIAQLLDKEENSEGYFYNNYLLQKEVFRYQSTLKRTETFNLQEVTDFFDKAYIIEKLIHGCEMLAHQNLYKIEYKTGLLDDILKFVEQENFLDTPRIGIYYFLYKITLDKNNTNDFFTLKKYFEAGDSIPPAEIKSAYLIAINFCINQLNMGNKEFVAEVFKLYKSGIERDIFIENGVLSRWTFKNIISAGLSLKEYNWVENFIKNFNQFLKEEFRESFMSYNYAKLYFEKGEYDKALEVFQRSVFNDFLTNIDSKIIQLKIYFEMDEIRLIESLLESMRAYLQRKKVMGYHKTNYKNIIRYTKKLLKVNPYSKAQIEKLKTEIEATTPLTEKTWLLKQLGKY